jgi:hypothetical protein
MAIVGGTVVLVLLSIAVVAVFGRSRATPPADPSSPAGVAQAYVEAVRNGELERSRGYLTRDAVAQTQQNRPTSYAVSSDDNVRIVIDTVSVTDTAAEVRVTVTRFYPRSGPFSSSSTHRDIRIRMIREDGVWKITQPLDFYSFS